MINHTQKSTDWLNKWEMTIKPGFKMVLKAVDVGKLFILAEENLLERSSSLRSPVLISDLLSLFSLLCLHQTRGFALPPSWSWTRTAAPTFWSRSRGKDSHSPSVSTSSSPRPSLQIQTAPTCSPHPWFRARNVLQTSSTTQVWDRKWTHTHTHSPEKATEWVALFSSLKCHYSFSILRPVSF